MLDRQTFYKTTAWRKIRAKVLRKRPLCIRCFEKATIVDHKIDRRDRPDLQFDEGNLQPLCMACHNLKTNYTVKAKDLRVPWQGVQWNPDGTPADGHPWSTGKNVLFKGKKDG